MNTKLVRVVMTLFVLQSLCVEAQVLTVESCANITRNEPALSLALVGDRPLITRRLMAPTEIGAETTTVSVAVGLYPHVDGAPVQLTNVKFKSVASAIKYVRADGSLRNSGFSDTIYGVMANESGSSLAVFTTAARDSTVSNSTAGTPISTASVNNVAAIYVTKLPLNFGAFPKWTPAPFIDNGETYIGYVIEVKIEFDAKLGSTTKRFKVGPDEGLSVRYVVSDKLPEILSVLPASGNQPEVITTTGEYAELFELQATTTLVSTSWTQIIPPPTIEVQEDGTVVWKISAPYLLPVPERYYRLIYVGRPQFYQQE